jgi:hypothetical protein
MSYMQPVVNLNGSSRDDLIAQRIALRSALMDAMKALSNMSPHLRDYSDVSDWQRDRAVYVERFKALDRLYEEVGEEAASIAEQAA